MGISMLAWVALGRLISFHRLVVAIFCIGDRLVLTHCRARSLP